MAEHSTVNRRVAGSSPAWGVFLCKKYDRPCVCYFFVKWVLMGYLKKYFSAVFRLCV